MMVIFEMLEDFILIYFLLQKPYEILAMAGQVRSGQGGEGGPAMYQLCHTSRDKQGQ